MATHSAPTYRRRRYETDSGAGFKVIAMLLGLAVAVIGFFALLMWADARNARDEGGTAAPQPASQAAAHEGAADHNTALPIESFAGVVPENADELAAAHKATDATLPPSPRATSSR